MQRYFCTWLLKSKGTLTRAGVQGSWLPHGQRLHKCEKSKKEKKGAQGSKTKRKDR